MLLLEEQSNQMFTFVFLIYITFYIALYARMIPIKFCSYYFTLTLLLGFIWLGTMSILPYLAYNLGFVSKLRMGDFSMACGNIMMKSVMFLNPQVRYKIVDYSRLSWSDVPTNAVLMSTHSSFFDALNLVACADMRIVSTKRALMKAQLIDIPIAGWIFYKVMSHFPVYFKTDRSEEFSVEKEKQAKVNEEMSAFMKSPTHCITVAPEGRMNPNPAEILPLRYGSLKQIAESGKRVFLLAQWNTDKMWHAGGNGGFPSDIFVSLNEYKYKDGEEPLPMKKKNVNANAVESAAGNSINEEEEVIDLEKYEIDMRSFMQREIDRLRKMAEPGNFKV